MDERRALQGSFRTEAFAAADRGPVARRRLGRGLASEAERRKTTKRAEGKREGFPRGGSDRIDRFFRSKRNSRSRRAAHCLGAGRLV